jgi:DNA-binding transcriptional LysR family regulator
MDNKQWQQLDLNLLRLFVVLNEEQNLSRAAERLHITPSAVSHALKRLRSHFDDELFVRKGTMMRPTPLCKRVVPVVDNHMQGLFHALKQVNEFDPTQHALHIRIAMPEALEQMVLPNLVATLNANAKQVRIDSVALKRNEVEVLLSAGEIDFALDVERPLGSPVVHKPVLTDQFCVIGWHQMYDTPLTQEHYLNAPHISVSSRPKGATVEDIAIRQMGFDRKTILRCQTYQTALALVEQKQGVLTLPRRLALALNVRAGLSVESIPLPLPEVNTHLYTHENHLQDPALNWVFNSICELFEQLG